MKARSGASKLAREFAKRGDPDAGFTKNRASLEGFINAIRASPDRVLLEAQILADWQKRHHPDDPILNGKNRRARQKRLTYLLHFFYFQRVGRFSSKPQKLRRKHLEVVMMTFLHRAEAEWEADQVL